jgi:hypothetical protein
MVKWGAATINASLCFLISSAAANAQEITVALDQAPLFRVNRPLQGVGWDLHIPVYDKQDLRYPLVYAFLLHRCIRKRQAPQTVRQLNAKATTNRSFIAKQLSCVSCEFQLTSAFTHLQGKIVVALSSLPWLRPRYGNPPRSRSYSGVGWAIVLLARCFVRLAPKVSGYFGVPL